MILVDSSIWIDYFKGGIASSSLQYLIESNLIITNDIILTELIPILEIRNQNLAVEQLRLFPKPELNIFWEGIRVLQKLNLRNGVNKVGIPDLIIAQQCLNHGFEIWSLDKHFRLMSGFTELKMFEF